MTLMAEMTWPEFRSRVVEGGAVVLLPVGATEQHGPHLPLGVDAFQVTEVCRRIAARIGGVVAPTLPYGYKSQIKTGGGNHFPGTTSLKGETLIALVRDILTDLGRHGARRLAVIDGHYENGWFLTEACDLASRDLRAEGHGEAKIVKMIFAADISEKTLAHIYPDGYPGLDLEHAAKLETSMMLAIRPDLVHRDRIPDVGPAKFPPHERFPPDTGLAPASGVLAPVGNASSEIGECLIAEFVDLVCRSLAEGFDDPLLAQSPQ